MSLPIEKQYQDILFHLEASIVETDRGYPGELTDWSVRAALEALIQAYGAEVRGVPPRAANLTEEDRLVYDALRQVCEWELGREGKPPLRTRRGVPRPTPPTVEEMVLILKRLRKSAERWQKEGGRRGYLTFVGQFL